MHYKLNQYPQERYRFQIYDNRERKSWQEIRRETGCHALINLGYFNMATFAAADTLMVDGRWLKRPDWHYHGILVDRAGRLTIGTDREAVWGYCNAEPIYRLNGREMETSHFGKNGSTMLGVKGDGTVVLLLSPKEQGQTSREGVEILSGLGCVHILRFDGSWSSQGSLGPGQDVDPAQERRVRSYLLVYEKDRPDRPNEQEKEEEAMKDYRVTPSAGLNIRSGPGTSYRRTGSYAYNEVVGVVEERSGWGRTSRGWVSMAYLEPVEADRATDNGIPIRQVLIPEGRKNRPGGKNPHTCITIHETGNPARGADAAAHGAYLSGRSGEKSLTSWHYTVDDHEIIQHIPDSETAYHAGDGARGPGNTTSIGIELCVNADGDFSKVKENAAALVRLLREEHGIPMDKVVQHNHWNGKDCPKTIRTKKGGWQDFLSLCGEGKDPFPAAVDVLAEAGVIGSPGYWTSNDTYDTGYVRTLILRCAEKLGKDGM